MTWHLKDRELEKKLIERFPSFVYELGKHCESSGNFNFSVKLCRKGFCYYTDEMTFSKDELEEVHEYNPKAWNEFPAVTPPDNVLMRLEFTEKDSTGKPKRHYVAATFNGITWGTRDSYSASFKMTNCRFRPWED